MLRPALASALSAALVACLGDAHLDRRETTRAECDDILADIRRDAQSRGYSPVGICELARKDADAGALFGDACARSADCDSRCCRPDI